MVVSLWLEFNQDGTFASDEWTQVGLSLANGISSVSFDVPTNAVLGKTGLRVRSRATGNPNQAGDACTTFGSGETEDYTITIGSSNMPVISASGSITL